MAISNPRTRQVRLTGGEGPLVMVRPWTMADRDDLRPMVAELLRKVSEIEGGFKEALSMALVDLFIEVEDQVAIIVRRSIPLDELSEEGWKAMEWADFPNLAQAIWELNVAHAGGLVGKLGAVVGQLIATALMTATTAQAGLDPATVRGMVDDLQTTPSPSTSPNETDSRPPPSASSPAAGEAPLAN